MLSSTFELDFWCFQPSDLTTYTEQKQIDNIDSVQNHGRDGLLRYSPIPLLNRTHRIDRKYY